MCYTNPNIILAELPGFAREQKLLKEYSLKISDFYDHQYMN